MSRTFKIILIALLGFFFSIATLEIDVFGYDNTFFDTYDSYLPVYNQVLHQVNTADQDSFTFLEVTPSPFFVFIFLQSSFDESSLCQHPYKGKLYLVKSSLLI